MYTKPKPANILKFAFSSDILDTLTNRLDGDKIQTKLHLDSWRGNLSLIINKDIKLMRKILKLSQSRRNINY